MVAALAAIGEYVRNNRLKTVGAFWATTVAASLAYNFSKPGAKQTKVCILGRRKFHHFFTFLTWVLYKSLTLEKVATGNARLILFGVFH